MTQAAPAAYCEAVLDHGGRLRGRVEAGLRVFRGIPYAQAPFGALRFQPPAPQPAWQGVRDALAFAPAAPQLPRVAHAHTPVVGGPDCLALNIWAPTDAGRPLPVMVWVHGGGFFRGAASDPLYDGAAWARSGVVFVSVQYRLGIDGFLQIPGTPDNRGLLDIVAALQWVRRHIGAWNGDAERVTVFGQSAGAGALACLLGMPQAQGLFQRAILQSPSVACQTPVEAAAAREAVAALAGVAPEREALAQAPLPAVLHAVHRLAVDPALRRRMGLGGRQFFPLRPVVDGQVLPASPLVAMQQLWAAQPAQARALQILVGSNADEMRLYHLPTGLWDQATDAHVDAFAEDAELPTALVATYRARVDGGRATPGALLAALQADYYYRAPALGIALLASRCTGGAHRYSFEWPSLQAGGRLGAAHAVELPFVFANLRTPQGLEFTGPSPPPALSQAMHRCWARFAESGDPGWPAFTEREAWTMRFGTDQACTGQPDDALLQLWDAPT
ncbi:carboxylesterase/lipase family protein [Paracidovorax wautersii]|uniref:Para-nitrobenzyl esterase n=1 Tax=Paracidovorax wautersii TaxID=1177982 RepID=A0A1I2AVK5_9BURK|nr:carboxylesterase family protein [Paracidovorax wautersii]SFE48035.1 para-nitrobenzyl esterase [Paracidovorax wautersii]